MGVHSDQELVLPLNTTFLKAITLKFCGTANIVGRWDDALALLAKGTSHPGGDHFAPDVAWTMLCVAMSCSSGARR